MMSEDQWRMARKKPVEIEFRGPYTDTGMIETIEGDYEIDQEYIDEHGGYVIIQGVQGEMYPCAIDIFERTYESVMDGDENSCRLTSDGESVGDNWSGELVAVDFDGTLTQGEARYWENEIEEPREEVVGWVRQQYYDGKHVVVWTARPWSEASTIAARLTEWEVPYHGIRCEKGGADMYIDDKAATPSQVIADD